MFDLRAWLRRAPKPRKLRLHVGDEERMVDLGEGRKAWAEVEQTVRAAGASKVECLTEDGTMIRAMQLTEDDADAVSDEDAYDRSLDKALGKERREMAAVLDAQGRAIERAYTAGARAAGVSQENLVAIVETLTSHLALAITNIHNLSNAYANVVAEAAGATGQSQPDALMGMMTAMIAARSGQPPPAQPPTPKQNGAKK